MISVPCTVFYSFVYPKLDKPHFWSAHYGDWAKPTFRTRLVSSVYELKILRKIFGAEFVCPKKRADLDGYNDGSGNGSLCGYLLFLNTNKPFVLSVCCSVLLGDTNYLV